MMTGWKIIAVSLLAASTSGCYGDNESFIKENNLPIDISALSWLTNHLLTVGTHEYMLSSCCHGYKPVDHQVATASQEFQIFHCCY